MKVNGKEIGLLYTVGVLCDHQDWQAANKNKPATSGLVKIELMSRAYAARNNTDYVTVDEIKELMPYEVSELLDAAVEAEKAGTSRKIETVDAPKKKDKDEK